MSKCRRFIVVLWAVDVYASFQVKQIRGYIRYRCNSNMWSKHAVHVWLDPVCQRPVKLIRISCLLLNNIVIQESNSTEWSDATVHQRCSHGQRSELGHFAFEAVTCDCCKVFPDPAEDPWWCHPNPQPSVTAAGLLVTHRVVQLLNASFCLFLSSFFT